MTPYPYFTDIRDDGFNRDHAAVAGLPNITAPWASPLALSEPLPDGVSGDIVAQTSVKSGSTTEADLDVEADLGSELGRKPVVLSLKGTFPSFFADKESPTTEQPLAAALPDARIAVVGTSELVSDFTLQLSQQMTGDAHRSNLHLLTGLVNWSVEDTELLAISSTGTFGRTLRPLEPRDKLLMEFGNYGLAVLLLLLTVAVPFTRQWRVRPITTARRVNT